MTVSPVSAQSASAVPQLGSDLTSDAFLTLLIAQFQYQDPLEPMSSAEMLTQMSQLTSVSELMALNENFGMLIAANTYGIADATGLLGKKVEWLDQSTGETQNGIVTRVQFGPAGWEVCIGDIAVNMYDLLAAE